MTCFYVVFWFQHYFHPVCLLEPFLLCRERRGRRRKWTVAVRGLTYYIRVCVCTYVHSARRSPMPMAQPRATVNLTTSRELLLLSIINYETTLITSQPQCRANNGVPSLGTCNQIVVDGSIITLGTAEALFTRMLWNNLSTQGIASASSYLNSHT